VLALALSRIILARRFPPISLRDVRAQTVRELMRRGVPLAVAGFLNMAVYRLDAVMLQGIRGPVEVATYGVAYRFFETFLFFSWTLGTVVLPRLSRLRSDLERLRTFEVTVGAVVAFYLPLVVIAAFSAEFLVDKIFSSQYHDAARAVPPLVAASALYGVAHVNRMGLIAVGRRARVPIAAAVVLALNAAMNAVVIPRYGFVGAAWTTFATEVVEAVLLLALFISLSWVPRLARAAAVPAVAAGAVTAVLIAFGLDGGEAMIVTLLVYPVFLVLASGSIARGQVRLLVSIIRNRKVAAEAATVDAP
jgi:O-antigen/teichoic acid export membrane protein